VSSVAETVRWHWHWWHCVVSTWDMVSATPQWPDQYLQCGRLT